MHGSIRSATLDDTSELARLLAAADAETWLDRGGYLLVLDHHDGTLGAVVHVEVRDRRAIVDLLAIDPRLAGHGLEHRMTGVAHALCEAYGAAA